jgi:hypothetical protein
MLKHTEEIYYTIQVWRYCYGYKDKKITLQLLNCLVTFPFFTLVYAAMKLINSEYG